MIISKFITMENEFVAIIGISFFMIPYQTHRQRPTMSVARKKIEMFSDFFSFRSLISCGRRDTEVKIPAAIPTHCVIRKYLNRTIPIAGLKN
jgi:hypothetical protein